MTRVALGFVVGVFVGAWVNGKTKRVRIESAITLGRELEKLEAHIDRLAGHGPTEPSTEDLGRVT